MGKKKNKDKRGKGAQKTIVKTEKNAQKKQMRSLREKVPIEELMAECQMRYEGLSHVTETKCDQPSPRTNMSLCAHPEKDELIMYGGELCKGDTTIMYNNLYSYSIAKNVWTEVMSPNPPAARCSHQAVVSPQGGGQMWVFGGEFSSPNQSQFYHFSDLWQLSLKTKTWKKIRAHGGPTARSGHRMALASNNKNIILFGGFHDNTKEFKYYNDVHIFNIATESWLTVTPHASMISGVAPLPRSAVQLMTTQDTNKILVYGGYSREDMDKGVTHSDMYMLTLHESSTPGEIQYSWTKMRSSGDEPVKRCGITMAPIPLNRAICFGGVNDRDDVELTQAQFYNDLYTLELDKGRWHEVQLRGKKQRSRRRAKHTSDKQADAPDMVTDMQDMELDMDDMLNVHDESVHCSNQQQAEASPAAGPSGDGTFPASTDQGMPCPRMNAHLVVRHGMLYMYGGIYEKGDMQVTLRDMYKLNLHRLDEWCTLIEDNEHSMEYQNIDSSSSESGEDSDADIEMLSSEVAVNDGETYAQYFGRCHDYWMDEAEKDLESSNVPVTGAKLKAWAKSLAKKYYNENT